MKQKRVKDNILLAEILLGIKEVLLKYSVKISQANRVLEQFNLKLRLSNGTEKKK
jgi:hypothetical protein